MPHPRPRDDQRCTAHSRRTGKPCQRFAAIGFHVCKIHGANDGAPQTSARTTRHLPRDLEARLTELQADPDLMRLDRDIELTSAMVELATEDLRAYRDDGIEPGWWADYDNAQHSNPRSSAMPLSLEAVLWQRLNECLTQRQSSVVGAHKIELMKHRAYGPREVESLVRFLCQLTIQHCPADARDVMLRELEAFVRGSPMSHPARRLMPPEPLTLDPSDFRDGALT